MKFVVVYLEAEDKMVVKNEIFESLEAAEHYADGIDYSRAPKILPFLDCYSRNDRSADALALLAMRKK